MTYTLAISEFCNKDIVTIDTFDETLLHAIKAMLPETYQTFKDAIANELSGDGYEAVLSYINTKLRENEIFHYHDDDNINISITPFTDNSTPLNDIVISIDDPEKELSIFAKKDFDRNNLTYQQEQKRVANLNQETFELIKKLWKDLVKVDELENKDVARVNIEGTALDSLKKMANVKTTYSILFALSSDIVAVCVSPSCRFRHEDGSDYSLEEQFETVEKFIKANASKELLAEIEQSIAPYLLFHNEYKEAQRCLETYNKEELAERGYL